jgi:hypothetical protein
MLHNFINDLYNCHFTLRNSTDEKVVLFARLKFLDPEYSGEEKFVN